jgi:hypothetical protein
MKDSLERHTERKMDMSFTVTGVKLGPSHTKGRLEVFENGAEENIRI